MGRIGRRRSAVEPVRLADRVEGTPLCRIARCLLTIPLVALLFHTGCFTARVLARAKPYNCLRATITEVTRAALTSTDLFLEFQARPPGAGGGESRVLRVPLNSSAWLDDKRGKPVFPSEQRVDQTQVHEVSEWFLLPKSAMPVEGRDLAITAVEIEDLRRLPEMAADVPDNVQVLWVEEGFVFNYADRNTGEMSAHFHRRGDPFIAILSRPGSGKWQTALIIANVNQGCEQNRSWYALVPLAVVADAATLPLVAIAALLYEE